MNLHQCMKTFVEVVDRHSFAEAARKRYRSAPQISKEINWLEEELGVQLLVRTTRKLSVTEGGKQFYQYAKRSLSDYIEMKQQLNQEAQLPRGRLVVTMPVSFGENMLMMPIMHFHKEYPEIELDLRFTNAYVDILKDDVDIAVRTHHVSNKTLHCELLMHTQRAVLGSPDYFKRKGIPTHPSQLQEHHCLLHSDMERPAQWVFNRNLRVDVHSHLLSNSAYGLVYAAQLGLGCVYLSKQKLWMQKLLKEGDLIAVLDDYLLPATDVFICHRKFEVVPLKVKLFVEAMRDDSALSW